MFLYHGRNNMKAYVIRLKNIQPSESLADQCVESGKIHSLVIDKFDGIYGQDAIEYYKNFFDIKPWKEKIKKGRLGVHGCLLSHYSLWLKSIELNESLIIFEHDAMVLQKIPNNLEERFDEFLLLDPYNKFNGSYYLDHQNSFNCKQKIIEYSNPASRKKYSITAEYAMGLQGYIIKPKAAKKLCKAIKQNNYFPADMQCNKDIINLQTVNSPLVSINKKYYNNMSLMKLESSTQYNWVQK